MNGWHGVTSIVNYVWSHSLDNASDSFDFEPNAAQPNDSTRPNLEYGNSNFDIRNRFTWIFAYDLPHMGGNWQKLKNGWGLNSTVSLQSGQPFQLNYNFEGDFSGSGEAFDRPDVVGPIQYNFNNPSQYLNLNAFATPCTPLSGAPLVAWEAAAANPNLSAAVNGPDRTAFRAHATSETKGVTRCVDPPLSSGILRFTRHADYRMAGNATARGIF